MSKKRDSDALRSALDAQSRRIVDVCNGDGDWLLPSVDAYKLLDCVYPKWRGEWPDWLALEWPTRDVMCGIFGADAGCGCAISRPYGFDEPANLILPGAVVTRNMAYHAPRLEFGASCGEVPSGVAATMLACRIAASDVGINLDVMAMPHRRPDLDVYDVLVLVPMNRLYGYAAWNYRADLIAAATGDDGPQSHDRRESLVADVLSAYAELGVYAKPPHGFFDGLRRLLTLESKLDALKEGWE